MFLVSPTLAIILIAVIIGLAIIVAWWKQNYSNYDQGAFHTFIVVFAGLGTLVTFAFYYNLLILQEQQQELTVLQEASEISNSVLNGVLESMNNSSPIIPAFVLSLTPLTNTICCPGGNTGETGCSFTPAEDPVNPQTCTEKMTLSYRIFSLWQDVIAANGFIADNQLAYVTNFLQKANSQQLYQQWNLSKINFSPKTQTFGDLLFEYGLPITNQTPAEYTSTANKLIADPRYQDLLK
jgi:hypothetical protein